MSQMNLLPTCSRCGGPGPFHVDRRASSGYRSACKACLNHAARVARGSVELVPMAPLAAAVERSGVPTSEIARRLEWFVVKPDARRVTAKLRQESTSYDNAVALCRAIGVDPVEVGL